MNIMLADHRALIRNAIGSYLSQSLKRDVIEAESYEEAMSRMETDEKFDVVLFEHQLPGINGLEGLESAVKTHPETPFMLLVQDDNRMTIGPIEEGVPHYHNPYLSSCTAPDF